MSATPDVPLSISPSPPPYAPAPKLRGPTVDNIACSESGCLATFAWLGHAADELLADMAKERGWRMFEGQGWICPHHQRATLERAQAEGEGK